MNAFLADPRRRTLAVLSAAALVTLLLAIAVVWQQSSGSDSAPARTEFFPGFAHEVRHAAHIHVVSKSDSFDVVFVPEKGWVVPQRGNYPASFDLVQRTLVGLAALQTIEPKTARPEWFHFVDLDTPPKGNGVLIAIADDKGKELASLIAGKSEDIGDPTGATGLFVRRPNEEQSWLTRSVLDPRPALADWLDKTVLDIDRSRIRAVDVTPANNAPVYSVQRMDPSKPDFTFTSLPPGKTASDPTIPDGVAADITGFGFDDVQPASNLDFSGSNVAHVTTLTFDGVKVTVNVLRSGADYWATIQADTDPTKPDAAKEVSSINAHAAGWAYKLPAFKGQLFMTTLDDLLKPPPAPPATPGVPPQQP
ncbi:MAG: DUF4340 domain-containing protein [Alphaproteobacteria bacterium]|nr:DUF4340 domain-containing protein [Alphaproteobacteria bacterium]MBL7096962.1 DUF4340 domain-containing protein [Alphaproteobacteria bacterium]